jgi:chemotaxis regulatin CheY-phosphate phosphatase CheZ
MDTAKFQHSEQHEVLPKLKARNFVEVLHSVIPTLDSIKHSIEESTGRIPQASSKLSSVTSATETATVEILNVLEQVTRDLESIETNLSQLNDRARTRHDRCIAFRDGVFGLSLSAHHRDHIAALWQDYANLAPEKETIESIKRKLSETKSNTTSIAMALQVQDITTQQIAGVNHLIESVQLQLNNALSAFEDPDRAMQLGNETTASNNGVHSDSGVHSFDSGAVYSNSAQRQEEADEIIKVWKDRQEQ